MNSQNNQMLDQEEYIEQAYLFRSYRERLEENIPSQDILKMVKEEILSHTKLPMAIDILRGEILLNGRLSNGMALLPHYFSSFQAYVMKQSENEKIRFDHKTALLILEREAEYRSENPIPTGLFVYQFECISRNRLGYDEGMSAIAADPVFNSEWKEWILKTRLDLGTIDFAKMIYQKSQLFFDLQEKRGKKITDDQPLFERQEGRIAKASIGKDPIYMFAAFQRQLKYPAVPKPKREAAELVLHPLLELRIQKIEKELKMLDAETKGGLDLKEFYMKPESWDDDPDNENDFKQQ
jgi:hypothetical protein